LQRIVIKRDGTEEKFRMKKLIDAIFSLLEGLEGIEDDFETVFRITKELNLKIPERVTTEELDNLVLKAIEQLIPTHYIYDTIATRQLLKIINKDIDRRLSSFKEAIEFGVKEGLYKEDLLKFDLDRLEKAIDYSRDENLNYFGLITLRDRYFTRDREGRIIEKPQWFFMRVAMGIGNTEDEVIKIYNKLSNLEYLHSTPTLYNSGTTTNQYSSCFPAGTPVITKEGIKNIEDVQIGDVVLTAEGNYRVITGLFSRKYDRDLYKIHVSGLWGDRETVKATDDHRFLILKEEYFYIRNDFYVRKKNRGNVALCLELDLIEAIKWVEAKEIKAGDYIVIPYPTYQCLAEEINGLPINSDLMKIIGYCIIGGYVNGNTTYIKLYGDIAEAIERLIGKKVSIENGDLITVEDSRIATLLNGILNGKLPEEIFLAPIELQEDLIENLFSLSEEIFLTNKTLAYQLFQIILRIGKLAEIYSKEVNGREIYRLKIANEGSIEAFRYRDKLFYKVTKVEKEKFNGIVYDFEVKGDHSFSSNLIAAHNCYVNVIDDSLESIMDKAKETAFLAKYAGGVGTDITRLRATGSPIRSLNAKSSGPIPFIKIFDTIVNAIQQGGRRRSSQVMYMQPWHLDIEAFLDLRETTGNPYFRTPSLNTALWMPDEIMRRIENGEPIYLFDPAECPELVESWGEDFTEKYKNCIERAERGEIKRWKKIDSKDFYKKYLFKLAKTGHPWLCFKDRHNEKNPCPEYSVINSSNLCVTGDTRLATQWGLVKAEELYKIGEPIVATYDRRTDGNPDQYGTDTAQCLKMFKTKENADVYEVITEEGYRIKATDWHEFYIYNDGNIEKIKLSDLKIGDKLLIQSGEGQFGENGYYEIGLFIGLLTTKYKSILEEILGNDLGLIPKGGLATAEKISLETIIKQNISSSVPDYIFKGSRDTVVGYLKGVFYEAEVGNNEIKLSGLEKDLLQDIQILLANFGIKAVIENGSLYLKGYNARLFAEKIGIAERSLDPEQFEGEERFLATVKEIRYYGKEDVFDTTQLYNHSLIFNGIVTGNCTEISIPNSTESTAVCTLASVNLAKHVDKENKTINWDKLKETLETMVVALDNILDKNFYPSEESRKNTMDLRPIGIGLMGFAEALVELGIPYDSDEAVKLAEEIAKFMRDVTYKKSEELAKERGAFPHYEEMKQKGKPYPYPPRRNAVLLAIAPTASISIIAGTTQSIDSYFSNVYSRDTLSGKFVVVNKQLIKDLEEKDLWNEDMAKKIISHSGSIQNIEELDGKINKELYKTAYEISPYRQIDIAAAFQKYIDQSVSKSLYIDEELRDKMEDIYLYAWKKDLKSTYYCFIDKTVKSEKYTEKVNKRGKRRGFGMRRHTQPPTPAEADKKKDMDEIERMAREKYGDEIVDKVKSGNVDACPTDPLLNKICPSCE